MTPQFNPFKKTVLFIFCALNELFFIGLYLLSFSSPTLSPSLLEPIKNPDAAAATTSTAAASLFASPWSAASLELARANKMDSFWPWVITIAAAPVCFAKQFINVVQLVNASKWLAEGDLAAKKGSESSSSASGEGRE